LLAAVCVMVWPNHLRADAESDYEMLFGKEDKTVAASSSTADDAAFAGKLLEAAGSLRNSPELQRLLCQKAYEFGLRNPAGHHGAIEAVKVLEKAFPDEKPTWQEMRLKALELQYRQAPRSARKAAAEAYLTAILDRADAQEAAGQQEEAAASYTKAYPIANYNRSALLGEIVARRKDLAQRMAAEARAQVRLKMLTAALERDPKDVSAREDLIRFHLLERDDAAAAGKLLDVDVLDHLVIGWQRYVSLKERRLGF